MEKGHTNNPNGRPKGSPNKRSLLAIDIAGEYRADPIRFLFEVMIGENPEANFDHKMTAAKELLPYLYGKRKPIDAEGNDTSTILEEILSAISEPK